MKTNMSLKERSAMKRIFATVLMIALCICFCCAFTSDVYASQFSGGDGSETNPYLIADKYQLDLVRNDLDAYYKMIADIIFTEADFAEGGDFYNNGQGWKPIGSQSAFRGVFDGNGHKISGLYINKTEEAGIGPIYVGLFGNGKGCEIKNLSLENTDITVDVEGITGYVGAVIGCAESSSTISNCTVSGNIRSAAGSVGGIAGLSEDEIVSCSNCANITSSGRAGGIAGTLHGEIVSCSNYANITSNHESTTYVGAYAGGIAGDSYGKIVSCSNYANITSSGNAGGVAGLAGNGCTVSDCFNMGPVTSSKNPGGIIGYSGYTSVNVSRCYNIGTVTALGEIGGGTATITDCFYLDTENYTSTVIPGFAPGKALSYAEMKDKASFTGFDFDKVWTMDGNSDYPYPELRNVELTYTAEIQEISVYQLPDRTNYWVNEDFDVTGGKILLVHKSGVREVTDMTLAMVSGFDSTMPGEQTLTVEYGGCTAEFTVEVESDFYGGDGSETNPYLIADKYQLDAVRNYRGANFKMIADVTFTEADFAEGGEFYNNGQGWKPIGGDEDATFRGTFDGNGHKISGLYINITEEPEAGPVYAGLFGYGEGCKIKNLSLENTDITVDVEGKTAYVGSVIGYTSADSAVTITDCSGNGKIYSAYGNIGGIAGYVGAGEVAGCKNYGTIDAFRADIGGIIGESGEDSVIKECKNYSTIGSKADITGSCAGIAFRSSGEVVSCYNYADITARSGDACGIVGINGGLVDGCVNEGNIKAKYLSGGIVGAGDGGSVIKNGVNKGTVATGSENDTTYSSCGGGIAGHIQAGSTIFDSLNYGEVLVHADYGYSFDAGGIVGRIADGSVIRCANMGNVKSTSDEFYATLGGISGSNIAAYDPVLIEQCFNSGDVYSPVGSNGVSAGISGFSQGQRSDVTIRDCFNMGTVDARTLVGGIIAKTSTSEIAGVEVVRCYNVGSVIAPFGSDDPTEAPAGVDIKNCFYLGVDNYATYVIPGFAPGKALSYAEMTDKASFTGFDFDKTWTMEGSDYPYPELRWAEPSYTKVAITSQPKDVMVAKGEMARASVKATGENLRYRWYYAESGSDTFSMSTSFTGNTYSVAMNDARNGRRVYCVVTDKYGVSAKSDTVTLSMKGGVAITTQPKDVTVAAGATAKVTLTATGEGLTYKWYFKNAGSSKFSYTSSFTGNSYSVKMDESRSGRQVYCVVTDKYGNSVQSATATLSMSSAVAITTQPKDVTVAKGTTAKVTLTATGEGLTYKWYFKNAGSSKFSYTSSFTGNSYSVKMDASRSGRQVYCVVTDKYGNSVQSATATLSMSGVTITAQPMNVTVVKGATAKVTVGATGEGLTYKWYFKNAGASKFSYTSSFTGNSYSVKMDASRSGRQVYCVVADEYGLLLLLLLSTLSMSGVTITAQPMNVTVVKGATAKVTVGATGEGLTYKWYFKNAGASKFSYTSSFTGNSYSVKMDASRNGRQVYCVVTDKYGNSVQSDTVTLSMGGSFVIAAQPMNVTVAKGETAKVTVSAIGEGLTYKWYFKNAGASKFSYTSSFTGDSYSVKMDASRDGRQVYCVVTDKYGNSIQSNTVTLSMK
ncbi:MAG: hypothetical protein E7218_05015 [Anaerofustis stercorihominis]|nr:hypothetical protein [Anaerofustis stercorihominis]